MTQQATQSSGRQIDALLEQYSESHRDPVNEAIHCICVPLIVFSLLGMLWALHPGVAAGVALASLVYYFTLSTRFALGMVVMSGIMLTLLYLLPPPAILPMSALIFVLAWIGQFVGHKIEGKKPSFLDDVRFLLIGPLFVLRVLYRSLNLSF